MPTTTPAGITSADQAKKNPQATRFMFVGLIIGLAAGYGSGRISAGASLNPLAKGSHAYDKGYAAGFDAARKKLADSGMYLPVPTSSPVLVGKVAEMRPNLLIIEANLNGPNPLETLPGPSRRTVRVAADTKITRYVQKTASELERDAAIRSASATLQLLAPFEPYIIEPAQLSDLKAGDVIQAIADHNILSEAEFTAKEIHLYR